MWFVFLFFFVFVLLFAMSCTAEAGRAAAIGYLDVFILVKQQYFHLLFGILSFIWSHRMRAFECRKEKKKKRKARICLFVSRSYSLLFGHFIYFEDIVEEHLSKENVFWWQGKGENSKNRGGIFGCCLWVKLYGKVICVFGVFGLIAFDLFFVCNVYCECLFGFVFAFLWLFVCCH